MHDSFIVDARLSEELMRVMNEIVNQNLKQEIGINHNMDQLFYRLTDELKENLEKGKVDEDQLILDYIKLKKQFEEAEAEFETEEKARLGTHKN